VVNNKPNRKRGRIISLGRAQKAWDRNTNLYSKDGALVTAEYAPGNLTQVEQEIIKRLTK